jgi:hypothetical protein
VSLSELAKPPSDAGFGARFYLVSYLPTYAATVFVLVLVWAGAPGWLGRPGHGISFSRAWSTAGHLGVGQIVMLALAILLITVVVQPFQTEIMRLLEGYWPRWLSRLAKRRTRRKVELRGRLATKAQLPQDPAQATHEVVQRAGEAGHELRRRFPSSDRLVRPTALGNVLAALEDDAGREYGLDAVVAWPRLYPLLSDQVRSIVNDRRDTMDTMARMTATMSISTLVCGALLIDCPLWWGLLALMPPVLAWVSYRSAVAAASGFADAVRVAFDLHRIDLLTALHMAVPKEHQEQRALGEQWSDYWRQGVPLKPDLKYHIKGS